MKSLTGSSFERITISYPPHFNTITKSGSSHFTRPVDGVSELIDNSITACRGSSEERYIHIALFYQPNNQQNGYLAVLDNGCGMDVKNITEFATYSLDRETRGLGATSNDSSAISMFGVGAKQAGFYLGDRLRVITKQSFEDYVLEFELNEETFAEKYSENRNVYNGDIIKRPVATASTSTPEDEKQVTNLLQLIKSHEEKYRHFTIIVIRLRPIIVKALLNDRSYLNLPLELSEIYYFQLHPTHQPSMINQLAKFKDSNTSGAR